MKLHGEGQTAEKVTEGRRAYPVVECASTGTSGVHLAELTSRPTARRGRKMSSRRCSLVVCPPLSSLLSSPGERLVDRVVQDDAGRFAKASPASIPRGGDEKLAERVDD